MVMRGRVELFDYVRLVILGHVSTGNGIVA